jgi:hypothetical protein
MTNADTRLYAIAIAIVSGTYSIASAASSGMGSMPVSASTMLAVGVAALIHGAVLLTRAVERMGRVSGPLMLLWAAVMLGNQALAATLPEWTMVQPMTGAGSTAWDGGMVAIAVLMLASGLIMIRRGVMR